MRIASRLTLTSPHMPTRKARPAALPFLAIDITILIHGDKEARRRWWQRLSGYEVFVYTQRKIEILTCDAGSRICKSAVGRGWSVTSIR